MGYLDYDGLETQVDCIKKYVKAETGLVREELRNRANIPIGFEYFSMNPNVPQGSLPLFGGEYSRATYADLWAWVQTQTGYLKTEADWQDLSTANNGNVPYYSSGDGSTTFRVPSLRCWVKAANGTVTEVGSYLEPGLPNITGTYSVRLLENQYDVILSPSDVFRSNRDAYAKNGGMAGQPGTTTNAQKITFDASRSSSIYGNSNIVQPESIVGMWLVKAYGTVVDTGQIDEQQYIDDRIAAEVTRADGKYLPLAGGTMTGNIQWGVGSNGTHFGLSPSSTNCDFGWWWSELSGAGLGLRNVSHGNPGQFHLWSTDGTTVKSLVGNPNGTLTWDGNEVERVNSSGTNYIRYESGLQICWTIMSISMSGAQTTGWTGTYYIYRKVGTSWTFPAAFVDAPAGFASARDSGNYWSANVSSTGATSCQVFLMGNNNTDTKSVSVFAVGRWK